MSGIKVALLAPITHNIPPVGYGPWELVVYNLAEELVKLGVDVTVFATHEAKTSAKLDFILEKTTGELDKAAQQSYIDKHINYCLGKAGSFDIIHNNLNIHPVMQAKYLPIPMVTTLHGAAMEKMNAKYYVGLEKENFVSISYAERAYKPELNYIDNVYNGVDFSKYKIREGQGKYFVFSGRVVKEKGILSSIELAQKSGIPLKVAGIITDQEFYDREVKPHVDEKLISFVGNLDYSKLASLLQEALATVCMCEWAEPFGLSALDSLASGVPVIATSKGAFPELVYDKRMGLISDSVDEVISKLDDIKNIDSQTCRDLAEQKFSRSIMAKKYLEVYERLLSL
jgi:glycosyltransferase involved in cell wall biosynthesis